MIIGIPDKLLVKWLGKKSYITPADEAEAVAIGVGYYWATKRRATVFMSADGFCNALNFLTSWVIPEGIPMDIVISLGRREHQHYIMTEILKEMVNLLQYDSKKVNFKFIEKKP